MIRLERSSTLGRRIRKDSPGRLGVSTWNLLEEAILEGKWERANEIIDYLYVGEGKTWHDLNNDFWAALISYVGHSFGEHEVEKMWREVFASAIFGPTALTRTPSAKERVYAAAEIWRAHYVADGQLRIEEKEDCYVMTLSPCPTGGRQRKEGRLKPPYNLGKTSQPYPWSWSRSNIPWYCTHCAIVQAGAVPIESFGYPIRVQEYPEDPEDPSCRIIFYKNPELIPEDYFKKLGYQKDPSKFKIMK